MLNFPVTGRDIGDDQRIILNAHVHLEVSGTGTTDVCLETEHACTHTFTDEDNQ